MRILPTGTYTQREGFDFFYNTATGKNESCSDKCDIPSMYEVTCKLKCKFYIPKERVTTTVQDFVQDNQFSIIYVFFAILAAVVIASILAYCFRRKLQVLFARFKERLCERLIQPQTETVQAPTNLSNTQNIIQSEAVTGPVGYEAVVQDDPDSETT